MKIVNNSTQVIHLFANQVQSEARTPSSPYGGSSLYFEGESIFSYGSHYKLGLHLKGRAILINTLGYSVTTSKQISQLSQGARHLNTFYSESVFIDSVLAKVESLLLLIPRARKNKLRYLNEIKGLCASFNDFQNHLIQHKITFIRWSKGERKKVLIDKRSKEFKRLAYILANLENSDLLEQEAQRQNEQAKQKKQAKAIKDTQNFREGKTNFVRLTFDLLRLETREHPTPINNEKGDIIEVANVTTLSVRTSQGLKIDINEARKLLYILEANKYHTPTLNTLLKGEKIGFYTIDKVEKNALFIGCHTIQFKEVQRVAIDINKAIN